MVVQEKRSPRFPPIMFRVTVANGLVRKDRPWAAATFSARVHWMWSMMGWFLIYLSTSDLTDVTAPGPWFGDGRP